MILKLIHKIRNATPINKVTRADVADALSLLNTLKQDKEKRYAYTNLGCNDSDIVIDCSADVCVFRASDYNIDEDIKQLVFENLPKNNKTVRVMIDNTNKGSNPGSSKTMESMNLYSDYVVQNGYVIINPNPNAGTIPFKVREYKSGVFVGGFQNGSLYIQPNILYEAIWEDSYSYFIFKNSELIEYPTYPPLRVILPTHGHQFIENNIVYEFKAINYFSTAVIEEMRGNLFWTEFFSDFTDGFLLDFVFDKEDSSKCQIRINQTGIFYQPFLLQLQ
jgi:hypothetical protein